MSLIRLYAYFPSSAQTIRLLCWMRLLSHRREASEEAMVFVAYTLIRVFSKFSTNTFHILLFVILPVEVPIRTLVLQRRRKCPKQSHSPLPPHSLEEVYQSSHRIRCTCEASSCSACTCIPHRSCIKFCLNCNNTRISVYLPLFDSPVTAVPGTPSLLSGSSAQWTVHASPGRSRFCTTVSLCNRRSLI